MSYNIIRKKQKTTIQFTEDIKMTGHEKIAAKNIRGAFNWIVGGYYNCIQDDELECLPKSKQELFDEIYSSAFTDRYVCGGCVGAAPKEMKFAGTEFCRAYLEKLMNTDSDIQEIAEAAKWNNKEEKKEELKMMKVQNRKTEEITTAKVLEDGRYEVDGKVYAASTFKKYYKEIKDVVAEEAKDTAEISGEKREKVMKVIKKLLALSQNNPSEEEAISAALKAQKLMAKYNISEIDGEEITDTIETVEFNCLENIKAQDNHKWRFSLARIIADNYRCELYCKGRNVICFYGHKADAEIAKEVFFNFFVIGNKLARREAVNALRHTGTSTGVYNSFVAGFMKGIKEALEVQCTALMIVTPKDVQDSYKEMSKGFTSMNTGIHNKNFNSEAFLNGKAEGKAAVSSKQIEG